MKEEKFEIWNKEELLEITIERICNQLECLEDRLKEKIEDSKNLETKLELSWTIGYIERLRKSEEL